MHIPGSAFESTRMCESTEVRESRLSRGNTGKFAGKARKAGWGSIAKGLLRCAVVSEDIIQEFQLI